MSPISKAQQEHVKKYMKKKYDRTLITVKKGELEAIKAAAAAEGESMNQYIITAVERRMAEEKEDDEFCQNMLDRYLADPDKGEPVPIEKLAAKYGITL